MQAQELRKKYLEFFGRKGHAVIPSAPLVPENDPTVLFTTAGMHPLVPYLLGEKHVLGNRLVNCQKCIRTGDIDEVGDATHLTFFEMLGNWSLGDYFKKEAIKWSFEFLTKMLKIPLEKLAVSVFAGEPENKIPRDDEAARIWQKLGVKKERLAYLGREDNWWGPAGKTGPCGPDTEMFYWTDQEPAPKVYDPKDKRWVEIWNDVFMQYNKTATGGFEELQQKNVDTGMGLERVAAVLQGKDNVFETELFEPIMQKIKNQKSKIRKTAGDTKAERVIADHLKASVFILAERVALSNTERGYVLRRLIRRAVRYGKLLGIKNNFTQDIAKTIIKTYEDIYPELLQNQNFILEELEKEELSFNKTIERGLKEIDKMVRVGEFGYVPPGGAIEIFNKVDAVKAFLVFQSFGFPLEMIEEELAKRCLVVDKDEFQRELRKHQKLSRTASAGQFKSGLADNSEQTAKYHTATHLLLAALRQVLGQAIEQRGSNITAERLRFDFNFSRKMTEEEVKQVEDLVNQKIKETLPIVYCEMETEKAKAEGAMGLFGSKYGPRVKVYSIGRDSPFSKEICAGPHAQNTGDLGQFKIIKEESSSLGVRRIKAVLS